jgi:SAM-dependent methyltransferase
MEARDEVRRLARRALRAGRPTAWFEELYRKVKDGTAVAPWADGRPAAGLLDFWDRRPSTFHPRRAVVVGCGFGDDAEQLARWGIRTTAFDISPTAIELCRERFPSGAVDYRVVDLLDPPAGWRGRFDFVLETHTLQVLPPTVRWRAIDRIADLVAPRGWVLVLARGRAPDEPRGDLPWPVNWAELSRFERRGLTEVDRWQGHDPDEPTVRRVRALYRRTASARAARSESRGAPPRAVRSRPGAGTSPGSDPSSNSRSSHMS